MKKRILLILLLTMFLSGCSGRSEVSYQDLFKIRTENKATPIDAENLVLEIQNSVENRDYELALQKIDEYKESFKDEYSSSKKTLSLFARTFLRTNKTKEYQEVVDTIVEKYPSDNGLLDFVIYSIFTNSGKYNYNFVKNSPVITKEEKIFLDKWYLWDGSDDIITSLEGLESCESQRGSICKMIDSTIDIINLSKEYRDEPLVFIYTLLAQAYSNEGYDTLANKITSDKIDLKSEYRDGLLVKGLVSSSLGKHEDSLKSLEMAYQLDPGNKDTLIFYIQELYEAEKWERLIEIGNLLLGLEAYTVKVRQLIVESYLKIEKYEELKDFLFKELVKYPVEFNQDLFLIYLLLFDKDNFNNDKKSIRTGFSNAELDVWYKVVDGSLGKEFFEDNFENVKDLTLLTRLAWVESLKSLSLKEEISLISKDLYLETNSKLRNAILDAFIDGKLPKYE